MRRNPYHITIQFDTPEEVLAFRRLLASRNLTLEDVADSLVEPEQASEKRQERASTKVGSGTAKSKTAKSKTAKSKTAKSKTAKPRRASSAGPGSPMTRGQYSMLRGLTGTRIAEYFPTVADASSVLTYGEADALIQAAIAASGFPEGPDGSVQLPSSRYGAWVSPDKHPREHTAIMREVRRVIGG